MRRACLAILAGGVTAALATFTIAVLPAQAATNLSGNRGFETGSLSGWSCEATNSVGTGHAHAGSYALTGAAGNSTPRSAARPSACRRTTATPSPAG